MVLPAATTERDEAIHTVVIFSRSQLLLCGHLCQAFVTVASRPMPPWLQKQKE